MHVTLCYDRTRQGMVRRTARGYGNGSWKKAGRKGKEAKYTTSARHRFKETEREETRGGVRGERACRPIRGSRRHATCDMRCAIFLISLDPAGPFRATLVRQDPSTLRPRVPQHFLDRSDGQRIQCDSSYIRYCAVLYAVWNVESGIWNPKPQIPMIPHCRNQPRRAKIRPE